MVSIPADPGYGQSQLVARNKAVVTLLNSFERFAWVLILLFYSGAIVGLTMVDQAAIAATDGAFARNLWLLTYALILGLAVFRLPQIIRVTSFNPLLILCVAWCGITFFWSVDPSISLRRSIALMMTTLAGLAFAARYDWSEIVQTFAVVMLVLCIISVLVVVLNPMRGIQQEIHQGAWRGPWLVKNQMGGIMAKGVAIAICAFAMRPNRAWIWIPTLIMCFALVLLSTSKTSLLVAVSALYIFAALRTYRRYFFLRAVIVLFTLILVTVLVLALVVFPAEVLALIGKDPTLTGRTDIWALLSEAISKKPLLGYGYGAFWVDPLGPSYHIQSVLEWPVPTAHNGWIDTWLSGGVILIVMFSILLLITLILGIKRIFTGGVEAYWVIISLFFFVFFSASESTILMQNDMAWFLFVVTSAKLWAGERSWWRPGSRPYVDRARFVKA